MTNATTPVKTPFLSAVWYDRLKFVAQIGLPALGTFYAALAVIWGFPAGEQVVGTIVALDVLLGSLLAIDNRRFVNSGGKYDGDLVINETEDGTEIQRFELNEPLEDVKERGEITLKLTSPEA